jgi:putative transcriptional regulator
VADKHLRDPNFSETVVLILTYDEGGAVGLVVNRETDVPVARLLKGVKAAAKIKDLAFEGGPVEPKSVLTLLRSPTPQPRAQHIGGEVYAVLDQALLEEIVADGTGSERLRFYLGFANWGPGQLDSEFEMGAWRLLPGNANAIFDADPDTLWRRLARMMDEKVVKAVPPPARPPVGRLVRLPMIPQKHSRPDAHTSGLKLKTRT